MNVNDKSQERAQTVLNFLESHPQNHNQNIYVGKVAESATDENWCGTTMCIAGATVAFEMGLERARYLAHNIVDADGNYLNIDDVAGELLGLDEFESEMLFHTYDNEDALDMLRCVAEGNKEKMGAIYEDYEAKQY